MAKFWRHFRTLFHNIPIPGVGVSINDAKGFYEVVKNEPGGTLIYEPPTGQPAAVPIGVNGEPVNGNGDIIIGGFEIQRENKLLFYGLIGLAAFLLLR